MTERADRFPRYARSGDVGFLRSSRAGTSIFLIFLICISGLAIAIPVHESSVLFDKSRNREIPIETYGAKGPVVIINHGYGVKNTEYSFIANSLAKKGYYVVSIQHDLKTDPKLPKTGSIIERRKPLWQRGVANILFVISELKKKRNFEKVILIGHSNGGDISMLFATQHPEMVSKIISLDSLRVPFPTKNHIPILSFRAKDTQPDKGVLPETDTTIIDLVDAAHAEMSDRGPRRVQNKVEQVISDFFEGKL